MRRFILALAAALTLVGAVSCTVPTKGSPTTIPAYTTYVDDPASATCWTVGDSLFASDHYVVQTADLIPGVANVAVGGRTLLKWGNLGVINGRIRDQLAKGDIYGWPQCVVIHAGAADSFAPTTGATIVGSDDFGAEIQYITDQFESHGTHVYWANTIPPAIGFASQDGFRQQVRDWLAAHMGDHVIDCNPAIDLDADGYLDPAFVYGTDHPVIPSNLTDWGHFSTLGAQAYASCLGYNLVELGELPFTGQ